MYEHKPTPQNDLDKIEITIEAAEKMISNKEAMDRLRKNRDFKRLFLDMYLEKEPARITSLMAAPGFESDEAQTDLKNQLIGISNFGQYIILVNTSGVQAKNSIESHEETREELMREDLD